MKKSFWILATIIFLSAAVKSILITAPYLGHFASYQVVLAMMADSFRENHFSNLLYPALFSMKAGKPALELIYYPWASLAAAAGQAVAGGSLEFWGRFQAIFFSSISVIPFFVIAKKFQGQGKALISSVLFVFAPMMLIYGRMFMNESFCLFLVLVSSALLMPDHVLSFPRRRESILNSSKNETITLDPRFRGDDNVNSNASISFKLSWSRIILSAFLFAVAVVGRNNMGVVLPVMLGLIVWNRGIRASILPVIVYGLISVSLTLLWLYHSYAVSESFPNVHSNVMVQMMSGKTFPNPLFLNLEYYKTVLDTIVNRMINPLGFALMLIGFFVPWKKENILPLFWIAAVFTLILLLPQKVYDHGFYLIPAVPAMALGAGSGVYSVYQFLSDRMQKGGRIIVLLILFLIWLLLTIRYFVPAAFWTSPNERNIPEVGRWVQQHTGKNDLVIASFETSPMLLYYSGRKGWGFLMKEDGRHISKYWEIEPMSHMSEEEMAKRNEDYLSPITWLERLKGEGAQYFVASSKKEFLASPSFSDYMLKNYRVISVPQDKFIAFDLQRKKEAA